MSSAASPPLVLISAVGLTPKLLSQAPKLHDLATSNWSRPVIEQTPTVTTTAQATLLTGAAPAVHGVVGNGWLFRETREVRFWQQSNTLIQAEPLYVTARHRARERGRSFRVAKLFWWFNQGADVEFSVTPKPLYGADGGKHFGIWGWPTSLPSQLESKLGSFPFQSFWGPMAGLPATDWIARSAVEVLKTERPDLTLVYLPHLDYDPQRFGPTGAEMGRLVAELDQACAPLIDLCQSIGAEVRVFGEYGHVDVQRPILPNRKLRERGLLTVRPGVFGDQLELYHSRAFAVCDHQIAHLYIRNPAEDLERVKEMMAGLPGVERLYVGDERSEIGLNHNRSGEIILIAEPDAWFAYPFWLDDRDAPDYARTVDIHRKPGYDPCELFFDPGLRNPKLHAGVRLMQKKLGFRTLFDVVPLDPKMVKGSHGRPSTVDEERPILIGTGSAPSEGPIPIRGIRDHLLEALGLGD